MGPATGGPRQQQQEEQLLSSCLSMLDIRQAEGAKLVEINPAMFRKPNAKAFELVLYHAYCTVNGKAAAKKSFRGLWPLVDKDRKQSKDFYQKTQDWLKESGQLTDASLAAFQRNPSGPKLVSFLCDLAHWALEVQHARMFADDVVDQPHLQDSALLVQLSEPLLTAAEAHNQLQVERLLRLCQEGAAMQQQAEQVAAQLKDTYYELSAQLRDMQAHEVTSLEQQPPSIRLASVLPAQLTPSTSGTGCAALVSVPPELLQQQQEVEQLWGQLQQYMQDFEGLRSMVQHLVGSAVHPYAIDAAQLRAYGQEGGKPAGMAPGAASSLVQHLVGAVHPYAIDAAQLRAYGQAGGEPAGVAPAAALDVVALVEAWLFDVGSVCRYVKTLAGHTSSLEQQQDSQARGWLPVVQPNGIGSSHCSFMSPLVASSDAASHATHLYAQLSLHRACRDGLLGLKATLEQQADAAAARMQALEGQLAPQIEQQLRQAQEAAEAEAAAAGIMDTSMALASSPSLQAPVTDWAPPGGQCGLFGPGHMQLIPPTPMLQQQVARQQHLRQLRAHDAPPPAAAAAVGDHSQHLPPLHIPAVPTFKSTAGPGSHAAAAASAGGSGGSEPLSPKGLLRQPEAGSTSPELRSSPQCSSASSAERPAAELLMSRELMDLDLVDDEALGEDWDDGGVFSHQVHAFGVSPAGGRRGVSPAGAAMARISYARFSLGTDSLSPLLAAALAGVGEGNGGSGAACAGGSMLPGLEPVGEDSASASDSLLLAGGESWQSCSVVGGPAGSSATSAAEGAVQEQPVSDGDDGFAAGRGSQAAQQPPVAAEDPCAQRGSLGSGAASPPPPQPDCVESVSVGAGSASRSPSTAQPAAGHDPLAPMSVGSAECMSSAKPRRLTFAAAASVGRHGCSSVLQGRGNDASPLTDTASSLSISSGEDVGDVVESGVQVQGPPPAGSNALAALRQRFADTQSRKQQ